MRISPSVAGQLKVDVANATTIYVAEAAPGVVTSQSSWKIFKVDTSSGVSIGYANNNAGFIHSWDDRASYTYG